MPAAVRLEFGEPIDVSAYLDGNNPRRAPEELTRRSLREIAQLAGQPDFEPQVGGLKLVVGRRAMSPTHEGPRPELSRIFFAGSNATVRPLCRNC